MHCELESTQIECTQLEDSQALFDDVLVSNDLSLSWATIVSLHSNVPNIDLYFTSPISDENGRIHVHNLGRSPDCQIKFDHQRISNIHCTLFCMKSLIESVDMDDDNYDIYIEDYSANGTFINRETRLKKGVRRLMHNGDEVSLINPLSKKKDNLVTDDDIQRASFIIRVPPRKKTLVSVKERGINSHYPMSIVENQSTAAAVAMQRQNTVFRLLHQERHILDYYTLKNELGSGASGLVYRGINKQTGIEYAIKTIDTKNYDLASPDRKEFDNLVKEAEIIRSLRHSSIIQLEDVFSEGNKLFFVMELLNGGDLFDRIVAKGRYADDKAKAVVRQLLEGIAYLHSIQIAHRDLKPENILLVSQHSDTDIKITDFGLAKRADENGGLKTFCGTPQYFAPEVLQRQRQGGRGGESGQLQQQYSLQADMWSVGVVVYVLLCASSPWTETALFEDIEKGRYSQSNPAWSFVAPVARDFIARLLVVNPEQRMNAAQSLQHDWLRIDDTDASRTLCETGGTPLGKCLSDGADSLSLPAVTVMDIGSPQEAEAEYEEGGRGEEEGRVNLTTLPDPDSIVPMITSTSLPATGTEYGDETREVPTTTSTSARREIGRKRRASEVAAVTTVLEDTGRRRSPRLCK